LRRRNWPIALAVLFVAQLVWYLLYTEDIVQAFRANAEILSQVYGRVQEGIGDPSDDAAVEALFRLQEVILSSGVPIVVTGPADTVVAAENLPFEADLDIAEDQAQVRAFARRLDRINAPVGDPEVAVLHFGDPPEIRRLRWVPWLQAGGLMLTVLLGVIVVRVQRRAESERAWTAMARELAHQLGTPISSLQGWLELLRLPSQSRPEGVGEGEIGEEIAKDLDRLERISLRFELIGREPELQEVEVRTVVRSLQEYLQVRLPRLGSGVALEVDLAENLPAVRGNEVLLMWAMENLVKNSLDALGGRGGRILISAREWPGEKVRVTVHDTGPGVSPEIRSEIFEPGVTTKDRGWGVGLALVRRIVEGVHGGRIELSEEEGPGATFHLYLPSTGEGG
jgi:signal transduction histidine kinase